MKCGYRIMMTELCEIPDIVEAGYGCTEGFSEAPYIVDDTIYYSIEEAEEVLSAYRSYVTGTVTNSKLKRIYGAREFYIEKIKTGAYDRKLTSYGAVKYAEFMDYSHMDRVPDPPPVVRWCRRKNYNMRPESCIIYRGKS